jgi:hypothetical protein
MRSHEEGNELRVFERSARIDVNEIRPYDDEMKVSKKLERA